MPAYIFIGDKMDFMVTKKERACLSIKDYCPHRLTRANGYGEFRPVAKRIDRLGIAWWRRTGFDRLYYIGQ